MATVAETLNNGQPFSFVDILLDEQQELTAVDRFSQRHEEAAEPLLAPQYRDLIPLSKPGPGEQYAFEVDMDSCSGCKSCVVACHNLNGLDEGEQWRSVGMLHGGPENEPQLQHVTTACHHCIDPACLAGCPVMAYDKDPVTGIVRHLDDQCIGCQYCVFMCPYDVPKYSPSKGIVRKCDMCHDRLAVDEAPACVQSCPNQAIRIRTVDKQQALSEIANNKFVPEAPAPGITIPTTIYKSDKPLPKNMLPADYYSANRQHSHLPLVVMLVLTQLSVGTFLISQGLLSGPWGETFAFQTLRPIYAIVGFLVGFVGMHAAVFHLGRPQYAFRAFLGLRTSWLSREIVAFGQFAGCAFAYAAALWLAKDRPWLLTIANLLGWATVAAGLFGVLCSVMIYVKTRRPFWNGPRTSAKFFASCLVLGTPTAMLVSLVACYFSAELTAQSLMQEYGQLLCRFLVIAVSLKLVIEASMLLWLRQPENSPMKRTATLLTGELGLLTRLRFFFGVAGGILLPLVLLSSKATAIGDAGYSSLFIGFIVVSITLLLTLGELLERYLFFAASVAPKMPGAACT